MSIDIRNVTKRFGRYLAVDDVTLRVPTGELVALLGPSGSGKTSLLRLIAGLEAPDRGAVHVHEDEITHRAPRERNVGFVFQHYALFEHLSVFENVAFGLRVRHVPRGEADERVQALLRLVQLEAYARHRPSQLSGGQRQRAALARALAPRPRLLLLDEPFGALDARVRRDLRQWLRDLHDEMHTTSILVTHDQDEALAVADRIVVMHEGRIQQIGTPAAIVRTPANAFVREFIDPEPPPPRARTLRAVSSNRIEGGVS